MTLLVLNFFDSVLSAAYPGHCAEPIRPSSTTATTTVLGRNETAMKNTSISSVTKGNHPQIKHLNTYPNTYGNRVPGAPGFGLGRSYDGEGTVHT